MKKVKIAVVFELDLGHEADMHKASRDLIHDIRKYNCVFEGNITDDYCFMDERDPDYDKCCVDLVVESED